MDQEEALALAEQFCRERDRRWEALDWALTLSTGISVDGAYVVVYQSKRGRLGGAFPVIVDARTGACRFVEGLGEYRVLRDRSRC